MFSLILTASVAFVSGIAVGRLNARIGAYSERGAYLQGLTRAFRLINAESEKADRDRYKSDPVTPEGLSASAYNLGLARAGMIILNELEGK